jgi:3-mercaptopyruvate sulfurtransferase SseA
MGVQPNDTLIFVHGDRPRDATLVRTALERRGHKNYSVINGGFVIWEKKHRANL